MSDSRLLGDLNRGRLLVRMISFGIPLVLGMFFHSLFNLVDLIIVGRLGRPEALGAINTAAMLNMIPMVMSTGINNASIAVISRNFGMRNYKRANANTLQSFIVLLMLAVVLGVPSYIFANDLNLLVGSSEKALPDANSYLEIMSLGLFTMFALMQVTAVLRAGGNARWPMFLLIGANVLNVGLTIVMVHGWSPLGIPKMGVAGAAWSTVIARGIFALFGLYLITRRSSPVQLILRRPRLRPRMIWNLTRIGIPSSMQYVVRVIAYGALLRYVTVFPDGAAAHNALAVGFRLDMLATFTGAGWGAAAAAIVGQALGRGDYARARAAGWMAAAIDGVMMAGIGIFYYLCAPWLMTVFGADPGAQPEFRRTWELGIEYLQISVFGYAFAGIGLTLAQALNGAGSTKTPLALDAVVFLGLLIPIAWWVARNAGGLERNHLWIAFVGVMVLAAALYTLVWYRGHWRHKRIQ